MSCINNMQYYSLPLLGRRTYVYNEQYREPMILTPVAERLSLGLSLPVFTINSYATKENLYFVNLIFSEILGQSVNISMII